MQRFHVGDATAGIPNQPLTPVYAVQSAGMQPVVVQLGQQYFPLEVPSFPTRGGVYHPGEQAAFPACEAAGLVNQGYATYV